MVCRAYATNGQTFVAPLSNQSVTVTAEASAAAGILGVRLYYATGLVGNFERTDMFDDGNHGDGLASDGIYGATIPGYSGGTYVRYYIEAVGANPARTVTYSPKGAEHDVFVYRVVADQTNSSEIAINEFMASNSETASDQDGEFDDWIERYNKGEEAVDLGGWFLSDNPNNIPKWEIPAGTIIPGKGYLIVWADENGTQAGLHANFKLSAGGENLYLVLPDTTILQEIEFPEQETDMGYARIPNGTGDFVIQAPTFNGNNEGIVGTDSPEFTPIVLTIFPNPTDGFVMVETNIKEAMELEVIHTTGQRLLRQVIFGMANLDLRTFPAGVYFVKAGDVVEKVVRE
ncbi:MAG: lamin tail domain-containing protein [Saprospiraceae bacterium]|nr:lamin tail domain-containing protein [Saprospiraceae bacterium]